MIPRTAKLGLATLAALLATAPGAVAAGPPQVAGVWMSSVSAASATFNGELNPEGSPTTYRFEYATDQAYAEKGFTGAAKAPAGGSSNAGSGSGFELVSQHVSALRPETLYHYRLTATNAFGPTSSPPATFTTQGLGGGPTLLDGRGFELVSPADKNGGAIQGPEQIHGGGVIQAAAAGGGQITYSSASSFGGFAAPGAPPASQYISTRSGSGWATQNITAPTLSGSYGNEPNGVPYQLFSPDLARGLMLNGIHCRGEGADCPVLNPPLAGSGAPNGYEDYYLRDNEDGTYTATLTSANAELALEPSEFNLAFAGASPDLRHLVLSTCAALTPDATEAPGPEGCDPAAQNLYEWSSGALSLINANPGAALAAQAGAVSSDGSRVYFTEAGKLYLREGAAAPRLLAEGGEFQSASADGAIAFYTTEEAPGELHLFRYQAKSGASESLGGGVKGLLGASADGSTVYFQDQGALREWQAGATTTVASGPQAALASDYPPATGTARVSPDGRRALFLSMEELTGFDNRDATTGQADSEVFLWSSGAGLACISCNPTGERPAGPSTISGAYANGAAAGSTDSYKPRNLSAAANRAFFDSLDSLAPTDSNKGSDAYEWEAQGTGTCQRVGGCLSLLSSGTDEDGASFLDASESGNDAYIRTFSSLVASDPGSADVYDVRVGGGFPIPTKPIPCKGDACVPLPQGPEDPTVGTLIPGLHNPPVHFPKVKRCPKGKRSVVRHGHLRCLAKHRKKRHHHKTRHHHGKRGRR